MLDVEGSSTPLKADDGNSQQAKCESEDEMADSDWEDGSNPNVNSENDRSGIINKDITIEFDSSPGTAAKRKTVRRASAEEKVQYIVLVENVPLNVYEVVVIFFIVTGSG